MESPNVPLAFAAFLHNLFTAAWIGGMLSLALVTMPALRSALGKDPKADLVGKAVAARLQRLAMVSIAGLAVTGMVLAKTDPRFEGPFRYGNAYAALLGVKHVFSALMAVIAILRGRVMKKADNPAARKNGMRLLLANLAAGAVVLFLSALLSSIS